MLLVVGETLVDLVLEGDGQITPALGGAPSNTALAAARLGAPVGFAGSISTDRFGDQLFDRLRDGGVDVGAVMRTESPSSLAMAELDDAGAASYRFYFAGTSVPELASVDLTGASAVFTGGLALVLEPMATAVDDAVTASDLPVVVDVNCRPAVIDDLATYARRVERIVARAAVVKVSDDDLEVLRPGVSTLAAAQSLLDAGAGAVIVTAGSAPTVVMTPDAQIELPIPPLPDGHEVVDTIGAGDTFIAGVLTSLIESGGFDADAPSIESLTDAVRLGQRAAAVVVTRRGADPPSRAELG